MPSPIEWHLRSRRHAWAREGFQYRGGADLLLQHGRSYRGGRLPARYRPLVGPRNCCFRNAAAASIADPSLRYCEGVFRGLDGRILAHAWCLTPADRVLELTLPDAPGQHLWAYHGAIFAGRLALEYMKSLGAYSAPLLDTAEAFDDDVALGAGVRAIPDQRTDWPILRVPYKPERATFGFRPEAP